MNPLADLLAVPLWQFHIIYVATVFFAAVFALYLRWEVRQVDGPAGAAELARGRDRGLPVTGGAVAKVRGAIAALTLALAAVAGVRLWRAQAQAQPIGALAAEVAATLVGGAAIAAAPLWQTERGAASAEKRA